MTKAAISISVVVPAFNEEQSLEELADRVERTLVDEGYGGKFELLFVDDGSTDNTGRLIEELARVRPYVRAVMLRTNCGKSLALMAGFEHARGDLTVTLDADLQDNPEDIPLLIAKLEKGYDLVNGWRQRRKDTGLRKLGSRLVNATVTALTGLGIHDQNCGFKCYRKTVLANIFVYGQFHRYIPLQAHLLGFRVGEVPVSNSKRKHGTSKYRAFRYEGLFDLISILFTFKYALTPLHFFGTISAILLGPSLSILLYLVGQHFLFLFGYGDQYMLLDRPLLSLSLTCFLVGVIILFTGFVCDLILYYHTRSNIHLILKMAIARVIDHEEGVEPRQAGQKSGPTDG